MGSIHHIQIKARVSKCCFSFEGNLTALFHINSIGEVKIIIIDSITTLKVMRQLLYPHLILEITENDCRK